MLNILIPMAGAGSRFAKEGYTDPKPLIPVHGVPMIRLVIENLRPHQQHRFIFVCQRAHVKAYGLQEKLSAWAPGCAIIELDGLTEGAACTALTARRLIDNDQPLMIANSDQFVDCNINDYLATMDIGGFDGYIMTMPGDDPKWSYVGFDANGRANRVVEKEVISSEATVGIYNFRKGSDFVAAVDTMIEKNLRVNGEFYVAPAYNHMIEKNQLIGVHNIGANMHGLGIPSDLNAFLALPVSKRAAGVEQAA